MQEGAGTRRSRRRWFFAAFGLALAAAVGVWFSGMPQKWTAEWALERNTGLIADVVWGKEAPELHVKRVDLYLDREARRLGEPLVTATDIRVGYSLLASGRKIRNVRIAEIVINADPYDERLAELPLFKAESGGNDNGATTNSTFIPREIVIEKVIARLHSDDDFRFLADAIRIAVDLTEPETIRVAAQSTRNAVELDYGKDVRMALRDVALDASGTYADGRLVWQQTTERDGIFRAVFAAEGLLTGDTPFVDVNVDEAAISGERVPAFLKSLAAPVQFETFTIEQATARIGLGEAPAHTLDAAARVYGLRLPEADEPLYPEPLRVMLKAEQAETTTAEATLVFAKGHRVQAILKGTTDAGEITAEIPGWTHAETVQALPAAFRDGVAGVRFDTFTTNATMRWTPETYEIDARAESKGGGANAASIMWAVQATGGRDGGSAVEGTAEARIGDRKVAASARYESADHYVAEAMIEEVQIAPWVQLFAGEEMAASIGGTIQGTIQAEALGQDAPLAIRPELTLKSFEYDTLKLDEITAQGSMEYRRAEGRFAIAEFRAEAPDGMTGITLTNWDYETEAEVGGGAITGGADLGILGRLIGQPDLYGGAAIEGTVRMVGDRKEVDFVMTSDFIGMGELSLPYGSKLIGEGNLEYNADADTVILRGVSAQVGEGTNLWLSESRFTTSPLRGDGVATLESDLQILVSMGNLSQAEAALHGDARFWVADDVLRADWTAQLDAATLALPNNGGFTEGVAFQASGTYEDGGLSGTGNIRATIVSAMGGSITDAAGPVLFDGDLMRVQQAKGNLFRGTMRADIDVGVLREGFPIMLDGSFEGADLAIFTDEVKPPKTQLTGTAQGRVTAEYGSEGLTAFSFEAVSPGRLSVNRSLVAELLQTDKFLSGVGANVADRAMDKFLGSAPQRPFDRGQISVELKDDKITGLALLESEKTREYNGLNLRITLDMDESALAEALRMLQETSTIDMDN